MRRTSHLTRFLIYGLCIIYIFYLKVPVTLAWTDLGGGDHGGSDWTISSNTSVAGVHTNIGTFTVNTGITATVQAYSSPNYGTFEVQATTVSVVGTITAASKGYPGVADASGTGPGAGTYTPGSRQAASGGGHGGDGGTGAWPGGSSYDSVTQPVQMGSSGSAGYDNWLPGGAGGGAIKITASGTLTISGTISVNGGGGGYIGGGAGGSIYLIASTLAGNGSLTATGGGSNTGGGSGGRVSMNYSTANNFGGTVSVTAGSGGGAEAGTIVYIDTANNDLLLKDTQIWSARPTVGNSYTFRNITINNNITWTLKGYYTTNYDGVGFIFNTVNFTLESGSTIRTKGFPSSGAGLGPGGGGYQHGYHAGGGGYGGVGGTVDKPGGSRYGSSKQPTHLGSGGGYSYNSSQAGGTGGGAIKIDSSDTTTISGTISSDGYSTNNYGGGGSGGSIFIVANTLAGSGTVTAVGGNSTVTGGGGGRIALYYRSSSTWGGTSAVTAGSGDSAGAGTYVHTTVPHGAFDTSGNGLSATIYGDTNNDWHTGKYGSSLNFDDSDNYISVDVDNNLYTLNATGSYTWNFWVKPATFEEWNSLLDVYQAGSSTEMFQVYAHTTSNASWGPVTAGVSVGWKGSSGGANGLYVHTNDNVLTANTWSLVSIIYDGSVSQSSRIKIFVNGINVTATGDISSTGTITNIDPELGDVGNMYFGNSHTASPEEKYNGLLDHIQFYNYARNPGQIVEDMNAGHPAPGSPVGSAVVELEFDEGYGDTAHNIGNAGTVGNADLTGTCPGASTCPTWTNNGKYGKALSFDGTTDGATITHNDALDPPGDYTLSFWTKRTGDGTGSLQFIVLKNAMYGVVWYGGQLQYYDANPGNYHSAIGTLPLNQWIHVAMVHTASTASLYLDGKLDSSYPANSPDTSYNSNISIARYDASNLYQGDLDELKLYSSALTADQIKAEYNQGAATVMGSTGTTSTGASSNSDTDSYCPPASGAEASQCVGPVAEWKFDENTGTTSVNDITGNNNTGTMEGDMTAKDWVRGKYGSALNFDKTDNRIDAGDTTSLRLTSAGTAEAWIYPRSYPGASQWQIVLNKGSWGDGRNYYSIYFDSGSFRTDIGGASASNNATLAKENIPLNSWSHVVSVWNGTSLNLYINGRLAAGPTSQTVTPDTSTYNLSIGASDIGLYPFDGLIDDVRIYNYARTPAQIAWDYNRGAPVAHWQMDEASWDGNANEIKDASGNSHHGTSAGNSTTTTGKINNAGVFDGANDSASTTSSIDLTGTNIISVSFWLNWDAYANDDDLAMESSSNFNNNSGAIMIDPNSGSPCSGTFAFSMDLSNNNRAETIARPSAGSWHHYVVIYDLSVDRGEITIYLDGSLQNSNVCANNLAGTGTFGNYNWYFMSRANVALQGAGKLDDVRIYNYPLNATQVKLIMNDSSAVKYTQ